MILINFSSREWTVDNSYREQPENAKKTNQKLDIFILVKPFMHTVANEIFGVDKMKCFFHKYFFCPSVNFNLKIFDQKSLNSIIPFYD